MNKSGLDNLKFAVIIAGRERKEAILTDITALECRIVNVVYGKTSVISGYLYEMLGFVPEENKVLFICMITAEKAAELFELLGKKYNFGDPNTGIAFTIPVSGMAF